MTTADPAEAAPLADPDAIRRALEGLRPEPEAFRAGIDRRLREREDRADEQRARLAVAPARLRWAASILPPGVVGTAIGTATVAGKKLGLKAIPGLLAIPAVATLMVVLTFLGALRALKPAEGPATERVESEQAAIRAWWKRNRVATAISLVLFVVLAVLRHPEVLTLVLLLSMIATTAQLGALSKAGFGDRKRVGAIGSQLLFSLAWLWFMLRDLTPIGTTEINPMLGPVVLCLGAFACRMVSGHFALSGLWARIWHPERRMLYPDPVTTFCLRCLYGGVALAGLLFFGLVFWNSTPSAMTVFDPRWKLESMVSGFDEPLAQVDDWLAFGRAAEYLRREEHGSELDLDDAREVLRGAFEEGVKVGPRLLTRAVQLGLLERSEALSIAPRLDVPVLVGDDAEVSEWAARVIGLLQVCGAWSEGQRAHLARCVAAGRPEEGLFGRLEDLRDQIELLDLLGATELADERAPAVAEALRRHWCGSYDGATFGGFTFSSEHARQRAGRRLDRLSASDLGPTLAGIELMVRFGVPEGIDLERVRLALARPVASALGLFDVGPPRWDLEQELARVELREQLLESPGGLLSLLIRNRIPLGILLLIALCLIATARAPRGEDVA